MTRGGYRRPDWGFRPQDSLDDPFWEEGSEPHPTVPEAVSDARAALVELWEVAGLPIAEKAADKLQAGVDTWRDWWKPMDWSGPLTAHWPETWTQRLSRLMGDGLRAIWSGVTTPFQTVLHATMIESFQAKAAALGFDLEDDVDERVRAGEEPVQAWLHALQYAQLAQGTIFGNGEGVPLQGLLPSTGIGPARIEGFTPTYTTFDEVTDFEEGEGDVDPFFFGVDIGTDTAGAFRLSEALAEGMAKLREREDRVIFGHLDIPEGMSLQEYLDVHRGPESFTRLDPADFIEVKGRRAFQHPVTGEWMEDDE